MAIGVYKNISKSEINAQRYTSEGKPYNLNHNENLVVDMKYQGEKPQHGSEVNSQGWERDSKRYFEELSKKHPEYFSEKNKKLMENGKSPVVDAKFVKNFPEYKGYENETLVHHHIGGDGQAVAIPKSMHKGFGEIHNVEKKLGVTKNGQEFSKQCKQYCEKNPSALGKDAKQLKVDLHREKLKENQANQEKLNNEQTQKNNYSRSRG